MITYFISAIFAAVMILIAGLVSSAIKFEGGAHPKDPGKRKMWFWVFAILNPVLCYVVARFFLAPDPSISQPEYDEFVGALPIATVVGFVLYIVLGFVLSKVFKNGKIGNWF
jgi:sulfoxide reductase heme-binding subunit YedZ